MRVLNTLYVSSHRAKISTRQGSLLVKEPDGQQTRVPMEALESIVLLGNAEITSPAMAACVKRGVRLTSVARNGRIRFRVVGASSGNVTLRVRQLEAFQSPAVSDQIARSLVAGKLQNSRRMVSRWMWDAREPQRSVLKQHQDSISEAIRRLSGASTGDRIRGIEGDGSRRYFRALGVVLGSTPFPFAARVRRPPRDAANALLSFGYALVLGEVTGALEAVGLDPQVGFLHRLRPGRPSLALDLIEELRPGQADRFSVRLLRRGELGVHAHFTRTAGGACYLSDEGRRLVLDRYEKFRDEDVFHRLLDRKVPRWSLPQIQATLLARHLRGDLVEYPPYLTSD